MWACGSCPRGTGCAQAGPGEITVELRPLRGKQEGVVFQAEGAAGAQALVLQDMDGRKD